MLLLFIFIFCMGSIYFLMRGLTMQTTEEIIKVRFIQDQPREISDYMVALPATIRFLLKPLNFINLLVLRRKGSNFYFTAEEKFQSMGIYLKVEDCISLSELLGAVLLVGYLILVGPSKANPATAIILLIVGASGVYMLIRRRRKRYLMEISKLLPDVVDFLSLCVSAGLDILGSLERVVSEFSPRHPLIQELSLVINEIKMGKSRQEALIRMNNRVRLPEVNSLIKSITQSEKMGTSLIDILQLQSQSMRLRRFNVIERMAIKAPIKLLLPLVIIMFVVMVIVGGPVLLQFIRQNPFKGVM